MKKTLKFSKELEAAKKAALKAGIEIMKVYRADFSYELKPDKTVVTLADKKAHEVIEKILKPFGYKILSEEGKPEKIGNEPIWVVDPLDGTLDFVKRNGQFCVMIGLLKNKKPVSGIVYLPVTKEMYLAETGKGAYLEHKGKVIKLKTSKYPKPEKCRHIISYNYTPQIDFKFFKYMKWKSPTPTGSMGIKMCEVARGNADLFCTFGERSAWDICSAHVILNEAGGIMINKYGKEITYKKHVVEDGLFILGSMEKEFVKKLKAFQK